MNRPHSPGIRALDGCISSALVVRVARPATRRRSIRLTDLGVTDSSARKTALVAVLHIHGSVRRTRAQLRHADFERDRTRGLIRVIDTRDDPVELRRLERPLEYELAGLLRDAPLLDLRADGAQHLEVIALERLRLHESRESQRQIPFSDREQMVGVPFSRQRKCADELPYVVLAL